jgi:hypothetical protein
MNKIYLVMSDELLDDDIWHTEVCRAFDSKYDANTFKMKLQALYRENKHNENVTRYYVTGVPFGEVGHD